MPQNVVLHEGEHLYAEQPATPSGRELSEAILRWRRAERIQAQRAQERSGLSSLDLTALRLLVQGYRDERDLSPKDLLVMLTTSSATVTNVVERLVSRGLLQRVQHPRDRRAHYLVPTPEALTLVDQGYVAAAQLAGVSSTRLVAGHVLRNALTPLIVQASIVLGTAILAAAALGFLGLGVQEPTAEWGAMLGQGRQYLFADPRVLIFPGIAISLAVMSFNLIGDGLRDALDPRSRERG